MTAAASLMMYQLSTTLRCTVHATSQNTMPDHAIKIGDYMKSHAFAPDERCLEVTALFMSAFNTDNIEAAAIYYRVAKGEYESFQEKLSTHLRESAAAATLSPYESITLFDLFDSRLKQTAVVDKDSKGGSSGSGSKKETAKRKRSVAKNPDSGSDSDSDDEPAKKYRCVLTTQCRGGTPGSWKLCTHCTFCAGLALMSVGTNLQPGRAQDDPPQYILFLFLSPPPERASMFAFNSLESMHWIATPQDSEAYLLPCLPLSTLVATKHEVHKLRQTWNLCSS